MQFPFARYGFTGTTTKAIADEANVSHSTVLFHFESKANLYAAVIAAAGDRFLKTVGHEGTRSFRAESHHWIDHLLDESNGYRLLCWLDDHRHPDIRAAVQSVRDRLVDAWCDWLGEQAGANWPYPTRSTVAELIVMVIIGLPAVASHKRDNARAALRMIERVIELDGASYASDNRLPQPPD